VDNEREVSPEKSPPEERGILADLRLMAQCFVSPVGAAGTVGITLAIGMWLTYGRRPGFELHDEMRYLGAHLLAMVLVPVLIARIGFRMPLREQGLGLGEPRRWLPYVLLFGAIVAPGIWLATRSAEFHGYYPYWPSARHNPQNFLIHQGVMVCVIFANEYFFRGYMLNMAAKSMPPAAAIVFQMVPYAMGHAGKVPVEFFGSIFAGLALGVTAWRGRSVWPCLLLHYPCSLIVDVAAAPVAAREAGALILSALGLGG
jgi:membrane protease YdiL (CAAX protease family)